MNRRILQSITALLLAVTSALSCSKAIVSEDAALEGHSARVVITGIVSSKEDSAPLEGIKIIFTMYSSQEDTPQKLNVYTGSDGIYAISAEGVSGQVHCNISAVDPSGIYAGSSTGVNITWSGPSFVEEENTFYVNDCNFALEKVPEEKI